MSRNEERKPTVDMTLRWTDSDAGDSPSSVVVVGLSHHTAPVDVRERLAFAEAALEMSVRRAAELSEAEAMLLSTCNRVELYLAPRRGDREHIRLRVTHFLAEAGGLGAEQLGQHLYSHDGMAAVRHIFRVAASLDSLVVGEPQILGQVKTAYAAARRAGTVGATLDRTVQRALLVAKRVRTETAVARASASVASAAVELARHIFGDLDGKAVLLLGAGKMAALAARHLKASGCRRFVVLNRTFARAAELAERMDADARPWEELESELVRADIVLCSTGAPRPVVTRELVERVRRARRGRWLCFIDIAVPRDVEEEVGRIDNVYLYDVDGLTQLVDDNRADRQRAAQNAEAIIDEELKRFIVLERSLGVVPTIKALRERCLDVAKGEAERTLARLPAAGEVERRTMMMLAESIVNKLLHTPLTTLKRDAEPEALIATTRRLFGLDEVTSAGGSDVEATAERNGERPRR